MRKKGWRVMPTAIISVSDKTGIVDFSRGLVGMGWELIASAGTARLLRENELSVTEVSELGLEMIDLAVVNLYPFE
jgi:phosphoribosylaminoimidazolecarboxamide formyltransferase/IMP cyclohydrolase